MDVLIWPGDSTRAQFPADEQSRPMEAGLHRPLGRAHNCADFFRAQPFHIAQHQRHTIFLRQPLNGLIERLAKFFVLKSLFGSESVHRDLEAKFTLGSRDELIERQFTIRLAFPLAPHAQACPRGDGIEPSGHLRITTKAAEASVGIEEGFLDQILRRLHFSAQTVSVSIHQVHMVSVQLIKSVSLL